jgi:hypothetical protein
MHQLVRDSMQALPEEARNRNVQRRMERRLESALDDMLHTLFTKHLRDEVNAQGRNAVHALVGGDMASAKRESQRTIHTLVEQIVAAVQDQWVQTVPELLAVAVEGVQAGGTSSSGQADSSSHEAEDDPEMPQTILHSDQQAQQIWKKAHDRAAREGSENGQARRAAYDALKQSYEKKGDRWVKKEGSETPSQDGNGGQRSERTSEGRDARSKKSNSSSGTRSGSQRGKSGSDKEHRGS